MNRAYDAIVVGGGMAGLTSAAYLCRTGLRTLLVEKADRTGGLVSTFWRQGFAFDAGIRAFENSGIVFPMLKSLGIDMECARNPVAIGIADQWVRLDSRDSLPAYAAMLTTLFPGQATDMARIADEIRKVTGYMDVLYGIDNPLFLENMRDRNYLLKTLLPWLVRYQVNIRKASRLDEPIRAYLRRYTENDALIDMVCQHFFQATPAFFALSYFGLYLDYCYPMGGTGVLARKVTDYVRAAGGEILTGTSAKAVDAQRHEVTLSSGETLPYRKLVWAADQKTLYAAVNVPDSRAVAEQRRRVERGSGGDSVLTLFMAVNLSPGWFADRCGPHAFYTPSTAGLSSLPDWKGAAGRGEEALRRWVGAYLERTTCEISCPALRDASLAPEGSTGIMVSTLMDYGIVRYFADSGGYESFKQYCTDKLVEVLETALFPGLREKTLFTLCATPLTIERHTGNSQGAITGWAFTNAAMPAENRFGKITGSIRTPISDVYQCGQWTFSPSGLPVSILTGKLAADAVRAALRGRAS